MSPPPSTSGSLMWPPQHQLLLLSALVAFISVCPLHSLIRSVPYVTMTESANFTPYTALNLFTSLDLDINVQMYSPWSTAELSPLLCALRTPGLWAPTTPCLHACFCHSLEKNCCVEEFLLIPPFHPVRFRFHGYMHSTTLFSLIAILLYTHYKSPSDCLSLLLDCNPWKQEWCPRP